MLTLPLALTKADRMGWIHRILPAFDIQNWRRHLVRAGVRLLSRTKEQPVMLAGSIPGKGIYRILICRPNHRLGNQILLTPLVAELQTRHPGAQVDLVVGGDQGKALFSAFPNVGTVYALPRHAFRHPLHVIGILRTLRRERYDLAIDPDALSQSSRLLVRCCKSRHRIGFYGEKSAHGLSLAMPPPLDQRHMARQPVALLRWAMGESMKASSAEESPLDIRLSDEERAWGKTRLAELLQIEPSMRECKTIAVFAHATAAKSYSQTWWSRMLSELRERYPGHCFIEILPAHGHSRLEGCLPGYYSSSPRRMASIIAATRLLVSADCGVMHLACAARGPRVVGLFKCTDPEVYAPYGGGSLALSTRGLSITAIGERIQQACPH